MSTFLRLRFIFFSLCYTVTAAAWGQNFSFSEPEKTQAIKNAQEIMAGTKSGFTTIKTKTKSVNDRADSSFQSRSTIFPAKAKSTANIVFYKKLAYYQETTEADIYTATQALKSLLRSEGYYEIGFEQQDTYTFFARAFSNGDAVIEFSYKVEKEKKYTVISIIKPEHYANGRPQKKGYNNWEPEKKGYGFGFKSNGRDSVIITTVYPKNAASKAGLMTGDLITAINNVTITQMTTNQIVQLIESSAETSTFTYLRNGKTQKAVLEKDWKYKYDKTCLSGDCANGTGVAMSNAMSGVLMEGKFNDGQLIDGSWYYNAKSLQEKGILFRKGKVMMNRFFTGNSYEPNKPDGGWWYQVTNHDVVKNPDILEKTLNGYVFCYSNKTQKYLWEGEFTNGKKSGDFAEYLYDKGFYWSYYIDGSEKHFHKLKRLTSDKLDEKWLNEDGLRYNENTKSWSGMFKTDLVNSSFPDYWNLDNVAAYSDIEPKTLEGYYGKPSSGNNGNTNSNNNKIYIKPEQKAKQVKVCSHCNGNPITYTYVCSTCNNTGWTNTFRGPNSYSLVRDICGCVGGGMRGYSYMKSTLDSRTKRCGYCNGTGKAK